MCVCVFFLVSNGLELCSGCVVVTLTHCRGHGTGSNNFEVGSIPRVFFECP